MLQDPSEYSREQLEEELQIRDLMLSYFQIALKIGEDKMDTVFHTAEVTIREQKKQSDIPVIVLEELSEELALMNTITIKAIFSHVTGLVKAVEARWQHLIDEHPEEAMETLDRAKEFEEKMKGLLE